LLAMFIFSYLTSGEIRPEDYDKIIILPKYAPRTIELLKAFFGVWFARIALNRFLGFGPRK
jgi:hypothetical protein